ncbi:MAG TPA: AbrB/MazE/SpoVT family DNA-binding domain-containing protein [Geminicoccaceae bacterium]|nr:AbrB/MazE/SpoVT family DNA-binding domain-containing protein [Geminicoccaceae bacterium]
MPLLKVLRAGQITLPADLRRRLRLGEGDYLEADVVENGLLLRPVAVINREKAWERVLSAPKSVRYTGPEPRPSPEEEERLIFDVVEAARHHDD